MLPTILQLILNHGNPFRIHYDSSYVHFITAEEKKHLVGKNKKHREIIVNYLFSKNCRRNNYIFNYLIN